MKQNIHSVKLQKRKNNIIIHISHNNYYLNFSKHLYAIGKVHYFIVHDEQ